MNAQKQISIVDAFNECINNQDIKGLSALMAENHCFIDRDGEAYGPKTSMVAGWKQFFKDFPDYRNTFEKVEVRDNLVAVRGYAYWTEDEPYDPVIWTGTIEDGLISEWRIYADTPENRKEFNLV
jgi:hypothetical protein